MTDYEIFMLAMTSVIVNYLFKNVFLTFYILQAGP